MNTAQLRQAFLQYFKKNGHEIVASSSLIPHNDPTLLFTNAGMVQFKDVFLGRESRNHVRAASSQRCFRVSGKHNDLENVGFTARHHTFFEMLGNFSFGDYFKREAINYAWEFVTKVLALPPERLWVTVYEKDDEAADIWLKEVGIDPSKFSSCSEKDNFWSMGDTGPCGPCSEIFYDHGSSIAGGPPGSPDADGDRYVEIWNLVFMQYNRDNTGKLTPLPKPSVDTGSGLERLAAVMQGVHSNYDIDIFKNLIHAAADILQVRNTQEKSLRVIADHLRACAFLVVDGVLPSNEGRGYVLRRIMRRAIRHGNKLGAQGVFFCKLVPFLVQEMGDVYPELKRAEQQIINVFNKEELQFAETLEQGLKILSRVIETTKNKIIPGDEVFRLYDTYGFPVDLTADIAREKNMTLDMAGFEAAMDEQRERARKASNFAMNVENISVNYPTPFKGYETTKANVKVLEIYKDNSKVQILHPGEAGIVVLEQTPFYAESGGQVGDCGNLLQTSNTVNAATLFQVTDTKKINKAHVHYGVVQTGEIKVNDRITASVNAEQRKAICSNHSATHLAHAALRQVLGTHVAQKGSVVDPQRLRFDFSHFEALTEQQITEIENIVNQKIQENSVVTTKVMPIKEAIATGAMALFGEKYDAEVRVVTMGEVFSVELCGGTHVARTGDIGFFKIISEEGIAAGVRRIEAVTGMPALQWVQQHENMLQELATTLKTDKASLNKRVIQLLSSNKELEKEISKLKVKLITDNNQDLISKAKGINGIQVLAEIIPIGDSKSLRELVDKLKNQLGTAVIVLAAVNNSKVELIAGVTTNCIDKIKAGELIKHVAAKVGGSGGGRADMAQAGGTQPEHLATALGSVFEWVKGRL